MNRKAAQDAVNERRLRPIYDWLDMSNNKKALQETEKVLKKQPGFQCCRALQAIALLRLGREADCKAVLESLLQESPTDDGTVQAMAIAFKEMQMPEKVILMYENAIKKEPTNEELLTHLFMAYVRIGEYKKQQSIGLQLYKATQKSPYYYWSVMSAMLQATEKRNDPAAAKILLSLSERMILNMKKEGKLEQSQEIQLLILVLERQEKFMEALESLEGPLGKKLEEVSAYLYSVPFKKIELAKKLRLWHKVNIFTKDVIQKLPDQWDAYDSYIDSVFHLKTCLAQENGEKIEDSVDATVDEAIKFVKFQQGENPKYRSPYLAEMEIRKRQYEDEKDSSSLELLVMSMKAYFGLFSVKPCCYADMERYVRAIPLTEGKKFFETISSDLKMEEAPENIGSVHTRSSVYQIKRSLGYNDLRDGNVERRNSLLQEVDHLLYQYEQARDLVVDYVSTDIRPNDTFIVLAGQIIWDLWMDSGKDQDFWRGVTILEFGLKDSPSNHHIRFILLKYYTQIGALLPSYRVYEELHIRQIQLDTLGHLLPKFTQTCGNFGLSLALINTGIRFFMSNHKEILDHTFSAYRCGSFDKIFEFGDFKRRLADSFSYANYIVEKAHIEILVETKAKDLTDVEERLPFELPSMESLRDNRDHQIMIAYESKDRSVCSSITEENFKMEKTFLKFRSLVLSSIDIIVKVVKHSSESDSEKTSELLKSFNSYLAELDSTSKEEEKSVENAEELIGMLDKYLSPLQRPPRSRLVLLSSKTKKCHSTPMRTTTDLLKCCAQIFALIFDKTNELSVVEMKDLLEGTNRRFSTFFDSQISLLSEVVLARPLIRREAVFEMMYNLYEILSFCCIVSAGLSNLHVEISPSNSSNINKKASNKNKSKPTSTNQGQQRSTKFDNLPQETIEIVKEASTQFHATASDSLKKLENHLDEISGEKPRQFEDISGPSQDAERSDNLSKIFSEMGVDKKSNFAAVSSVFATDDGRTFLETMDKTQREIAAELEKSYKDAFFQFREVIKLKKQFLKK